MPVANPLEAMLSDQARERLESGAFVCVGMAGNNAIAPIMPFLKKTFDLVEEQNELAIVVVRMDRSKR